MGRRDARGAGIQAVSGAVRAEDLGAFCAAVFAAAGVPARVATIVADSLVCADLRGVDSHGVLRLPIYLKRVAGKMIDVAAEPRVERDDGPTVRIDGGNNFGAYVGQKALEVALDRAGRHGVACVGVRASNHFGTAAYFAEQATAMGYAAIVMSNASQTMPPTGGLRPFIGTNPLAIAFPTREGAPFLLDMATSHVARGKILSAAKKGDTIPLGWAIDKAGRPTTDASAALDGAVLPVGGAKGSGLSMGIDILSGVLTGAGYGPHIRNMYDDWHAPQNVGHFFFVLDVRRFLPLAMFTERLADYIALLKAEPRADGFSEILYAGEHEHRLATARRAEGIVLPPALIEELSAIGRERGVAWPAPAAVGRSGKVAAEP
nr:Ldh family oxidoreductase [Rhodoplanes elegans]